MSATLTPLRRNTDFQLLWSGSVFAFLGKEVTDLVYPLVVLAVTGSAAWAGAFGGVQLTVSLLAGLPAGAIADACDRRVLLIIMEIVRGLASVSVVIALLAHALTLPHLMIVAAVIGAVQPLGGSARMLLVRAVVPPRQLTAALTQEELRSNAAGLAGPPLGGFLYSAAALLPFLTAALSFLISLVCALFVRIPARTATEKSAAEASVGRGATETPAGGGVAGASAGTVVAGALAGLVALWRTPLLRHGTIFAAALNTVTAPLILIITVLLTRDGVSPARIGLTSFGLALGGLAGTPLVAPLHRRLTPGRLMLLLGVTAVAFIAGLALPWGSWWLAADLFLLGLGGPSMRVLVDVLIFRQIPDEQRGRAFTGFMTVLSAGAALGMFGSGLLLANLPGAGAVLLLAVLLAITVCWAMTDRHIREARWPPES